MFSEIATKIFHRVSYFQKQLHAHLNIFNNEMTIEGKSHVSKQKTKAKLKSADN